MYFGDSTKRAGRYGVGERDGLPLKQFQPEHLGLGESQGRLGPLAFEMAMRAPREGVRWSGWVPECLEKRRLEISVSARVPFG